MMKMTKKQLHNDKPFEEDKKINKKIQLFHSLHINL